VIARGEQADHTRISHLMKQIDGIAGCEIEMIAAMPRSV
jgi:hypothetical protein